MVVSARRRRPPARAPATPPPQSLRPPGARPTTKTRKLPRVRPPVRGIPPFTMRAATNRRGRGAPYISVAPSPLTGRRRGVEPLLINRRRPFETARPRGVRRSRVRVAAAAPLARWPNPAPLGSRALGPTPPPLGSRALRTTSSPLGAGATCRPASPVVTPNSASFDS